MHLFEILLMLTTLTMLVVTSFYGRHRKIQKILIYIGAGSLALHFVFETIRWQMIFIYLIYIIISMLLLKKTIAHLVLRWIGFVFGLLFIFTSVFFAVGMPVLTLPAPAGEYNVGTTSYALLDNDRDETHTKDPYDKRELFIEIWYPGKLNEPTTPKSLWSELYKGQRDVVSVTMNYLKGVKTHSFPEIPANLDDGPFPLILFNHGLQMFTSQSTLLMEHLASNGYIIVSIAHPYESIRVNLDQRGTVLPEFITSFEKFSESMEWIKKASLPINAAMDSIETIENRSERSEIMLRAIRNSEVNKVVENWAKDNQFVLDQLLKTDEKPLRFHELIDPAWIGVMGMSIGGATAGELCKLDNRIIAGINVDGLQYGKTRADSLNVPFMMIYSDDGAGLNDFMMLRSNHDYYEYHFNGSRHPDFTDMPLVWPVMKVYGQLGSIPGDRVIDLTNKVILNFWDHYLKQKPFSEFQERDYPELEIVTKYAQ